MSHGIMANMQAVPSRVSYYSINEARHGGTSLFVVGSAPSGTTWAVKNWRWL